MTSESKPNKPIDSEIGSTLVSGNRAEIPKPKTPRMSERIKRRHHSIYVANDAWDHLFSDAEYFGYKSCSWNEALIRLGHEWRKKIESTHGNLEDLKKEPMFQLNVFQLNGDINITSKYEIRGRKPAGRAGFNREKEIKWAQRLAGSSDFASYNIVAIADKVHSDLECDPSLREEPFYDLLIATLQKKGLEV